MDPGNECRDDIGVHGAGCTVHTHVIAGLVPAIHRAAYSELREYIRPQPLAYDEHPSTGNASLRLV
jgi:hypothetical protein